MMARGVVEKVDGDAVKAGARMGTVVVTKTVTVDPLDVDGHQVVYVDQAAAVDDASSIRLMFGADEMGEAWAVEAARQRASAARGQAMWQCSGRRRSLKEGRTGGGQSGREGEGVKVLFEKARVVVAVQWVRTCKRR